MSTPRYFQRVPVFDSVEDALDWCAERTDEAPRLHRRPGGDVVGCVEVPGEERDE